MSNGLTIFIAYILGLLSLVCDFFDPYSGIFGALFKYIVLFGLGMALINVYARKGTLSNTSTHSYYRFLETRGIMNEQTGRKASLVVYKSMLGLVRLCSALTIACSVGLNGMLTLMVVKYPTDLSLSPVALVGKPAGVILLVVGLAMSIASTVLFWKAAKRLGSLF